MRYKQLAFLLLFFIAVSAIGDVNFSYARGGKGGGSVSVKGYTRKDGTYVQPHYRSAPDGNFNNNWSTKGNVNPYTGKEGTKTDNSPQLHDRPYNSVGGQTGSNSNNPQPSSGHILKSSDLPPKTQQKTHTSKDNQDDIHSTTDRRDVPLHDMEKIEPSISQQTDDLLVR